MSQRSERQADKLLATAEKSWNYLFGSLERLAFKSAVSEKDKGYLFFANRRLREIKSTLINVRDLIGSSDVSLPEMLEKNLCKKLRFIINHMREMSIELDKIYLK